MNRLLCLAPLVLLAAGCAMTPAATPGLESARLSYAQAAGHPEVPLRAPVELQVAERSLAQAERLWRDGADPALVAHHAYLADQRARIAMASADYRKAEALVATSGEQRNRVLLEARTRELQAQKQEPEAQKLEPQRTQGGLVFMLSGDLLFYSGGALLKPEAGRTLEKIAQAARNQPHQRTVIEGFTDSAGSTELNSRLPEQRAQAVKAALVSRGVDAQRIQARGHGPRVQVVIATILQ